MSALYKILLLAGALLLSACQTAPRQANEAGRAHVSWAQPNTIYELNTRQFSSNGTFASVEQRLVAIKDLGIKTIWFMPIQPIGQKNRKGSLGSYYSISNYTAINPEFGTLDDFKRLVNKIHAMDMKVIMDWVANHTAWDHPWISEHPDWYTTDSNGQIIAPVTDWTDVADLNYDNPELRAAMIDAMKFWVTETGIDGFRCDVAEMVPIDFWERAVTELDSIKPLFMLAEGNKPILHHKAFDATYSWELFHLMNEIAAGHKPARAIDSVLTREQNSFPASAMRMRFTTNHDENSWNGTVFERLGDGAKTFAVLTATIPGVPLLYSGQEADMRKRLNFFERDPILWHNNDFRRFYGRLFKLHQNNPALNNGTFEILETDQPEKVFTFQRIKDEQQVVVVLNLSTEAVSAEWNVNDLSGDYREYFTARPHTLHNKQNVRLAPWEYRVYVKQ